MAGKIWKILGAEPRSRAQTVLSRCQKVETVDCWRSDDHNVRLGVFLQSHMSDSDPGGPDSAKVCIAYESYHPAPMLFTRRLHVSGGSLADYDPEEVLELAAGRNRGRNYRSGILPQWVRVERQPEGVATIDAHVAVVENSPALGGAPFALSVTFPEEKPLTCSCC